MAEICRRASAQGMGFTLPESSSSIRRAISWLHASSADASTVSSRLSRSDPASAARASAGRANAFFSRSETSSVMCSFYSLVKTRPVSPNHATHPLTRTHALVLPSGNGPDDDKGLLSGRDSIGQWGVRRLMGQILLTGEEAQERPALLCDVVADGTAQHGIAGLER